MKDNLKNKNLSDKDMELISGGARSYDGWTWKELAKGSYVNYGQYIVYIVAGGDALIGISKRFGVSVQQI